MHHHDNAICVARWRTAGSVAAIATVRREVTAFARRHGMEPELRHDVGIAVSEAVAATLAGIVSREAGRGRLTVSAATDGAWLSVRIACDADRPVGGSQSALPLAAALAERVEWGPGGGDSGSSVLMEFPMHPSVAASSTADRASAGRPEEPRRGLAHSTRSGRSRPCPAAPRGRARRRR